MNIVGIIPARMGSSRFPGKPLVKICGIAMVGHVYFRSKLCGMLNDVYIATPDKEIEDYGLSIGAKVIMTSDLHQRASDRAKEAMLSIEKITRKRVDIAVMIQGDEPMLYPDMLTAAIEPLVEDSGVSVSNLMAPLKSMHEIEDSNVVKVVTDIQRNALYFSREPIPSGKKCSGGRQVFKQIALIPFKRDVLIKFGELAPTPLEGIESVDMLRLLEYGYKVRMVPTNFEIYGVDIPDDVARVEERMKKDKLFLGYKDGAVK